MNGTEKNPNLLSFVFGGVESRHPLEVILVDGVPGRRLVLVFLLDLKKNRKKLLNESWV